MNSIANNSPASPSTPPSSIHELLHDLKKRGIVESDYAAHVDRYLEYKARSNLVPLHGDFALTPLCNLDCKMCYVHLSPFQFGTSHLLPPETWIALIIDAHAMGMLYANLTGGECLTHAGFDEVYLHLRNLGIRTCILTNGLLLNKDRVEFFKRYPPRAVQVAFYGASDDEYERVTGHRVFHKVCENIVRMRNASLPVKVTLTPNAFMDEDHAALIRMAASFGLPYNINANLIPPRRDTGRSTCDIPVERYVRIYQERAALDGNRLVETDLTELPDVGSCGAKRFGLVCGAGRSSFCIKCDGSMTPCPSLGELESHPLKDSFKRAWRQVNEMAVSYPLPEKCGACVYYDRCLRCAAMHKNAPLTGHCDPRICERTKKLMAAGFIPSFDSSLV